ECELDTEALEPGLELVTNDVAKSHLCCANLGAHDLEASGDIEDGLADFVVAQLGGELSPLEHRRDRRHEVGFSGAVIRHDEHALRVDRTVETKVREELLD